MKKYLFPILPILILLLSADFALAQCPMCKASVEANLRDGGSAGLGLNAGIIYLFLTPYILAVSIGLLFWWKNRKGKTKLS